MMRQLIKALFTAVLLFCFAGNAFADETTSSEDSSRGATHYRIDNRAYWKGYATDGYRLLTAPADWDGHDWLKAGAVVGATGGLYIFDARIQNWVQRNRTTASNDMATVFKHAGDEMYVLPGLAVLYVYGDVADNERARRTTMLGVQSWFYSSALTLGLKSAAGRHRPNTGDPYDRWDGGGISNSNASMSFPSGHASTAFSVASVIAEEYDDVAAVPPLAYGIAALAALSRVNDNDHWASDVFFSSASGYFIGKSLVKWHKPDSYGSLSLIPIFDGKTAILYVDYNF